MRLWNREPALILAVVQTGLALGMGFGLTVTVEQMALMMAFTSALLGVLTRSQVSPSKG